MTHNLIPDVDICLPKPNAIVNNPIRISGIGTGFEGVILFRVLDGNGVLMAEHSYQVAGTGIWKNFCVELALDKIPATTHGRLEAYNSTGRGTRTEPEAIVKILFGNTIVNNYSGFSVYTVEPGDTLFGIAEQFYGNGKLYPRISQANPNRISDPTEIEVGQQLRVPISFS